MAGLPKERINPISDKRGKRKRGISVWLVTWDGAGQHAEVHESERIAASLNPRLSAEHVRVIVELLYVNSSLGLEARIRYAKSGHTTYPAQFGRLKRVPWMGQMTCGHNPYLFARKVDDLRMDANASVGISWKERPFPKVNT